MEKPPVLYTCFDDLPEDIRKALIRLDPGRELEDYIIRRIPALGPRSILEIMNADGKAGEKRVLDFILSAIAKFNE